MKLEITVIKRNFWNIKKHNFTIDKCIYAGQRYIVNKPVVIINKSWFIVLVNNRLFQYSVYLILKN